MVFLHLFIAAVLRVHCTSAYIVPSGYEPACPFLTCENGGTPNTECTCTCTDGYSGPLCESEVLPSAWPGGHYAIPTSTFGCPEDDRFGWHHGYINMTLLPGSRDIIFNDDDPLTNEPHIMGPFHTKGFQFNFCSKTQETRNYGLKWPLGDYCLYQMGAVCPVGFTEGWVQMRGYTFNNTIGGALPTFKTQEGSLTLWFCCRHDGEPSTPISLPHTFPFVLLKGPSVQGCQTVHEMTVKEEWIFLTNKNADWAWNGTLPAITRTGSHVGFPFCYYRPIAERECYDPYDRGASYRGVQNVSASGNPCVVWHDIPNGGFVPNKFYTGEFDNNYCRAIGQVTYRPSCYTDFNGTLEYCSVPICEDTDIYLENVEDNKPIYVENYSPENHPFYATDGTVKAYESERPVLKPFLQIDLQSWYEVHAVIIRRNKNWFPVNLRQVGVFVSKHQWDFLDYGAVRCDDVRYPHKNKRYRFQCKRPIVGQFVTIRNFDSTDPVVNWGQYFYMEINEISVKAQWTYCGMQMGMISGDIFDYQLESSSQLKGEMWADYGRVGKLGEGWCPSEHDRDPWFMVDLLFPTKVQGILLQGWKKLPMQIIVKKFTLSYGIHLDNLADYQDTIGIKKVFETANHFEATAIQRFIFQHEIYTRFIKIHPLGTGMDRCLKLEIIGCPRRIIRDEWCGQGSQDYGLEEQKYVSFWTNEGPGSPENYIYNTSIEECRRKLKESSHFVSFSYGLAYGVFDCELKYSSRHTEEHQSSFVGARSRNNRVGQKFCINDVLPYHDCNGWLILEPNQTSTIKSPSFPFSYGQGIQCHWYIQASVGKFVHLEIVSLSLDKPLMWNDVFEEGRGCSSLTICADQLHIDVGLTDPISISYSSQNTFQGSRIMSLTNVVYVIIKSCIRYAKSELRRFEIRATEIDIPGCLLGSGRSFTVCTEPQAFISTPRFPSDIVKNDACRWEIRGQNGQYVELEIIELNIADRQIGCTNTFVAVYDVSKSSEQTLLRKMCNTDRPYSNLISSWNLMLIEFRAGDGSGKGFLGRYYLRDFSLQNQVKVSTENCQEGWYGMDSSCYKMMTNISGLTWLDANNICRSNGGHLVSINNKNEMKAIHYLYTTHWIMFGLFESYIGLKKNKDKDGNENYKWTDGSLLTYTAWYKDPVTSKSQPDGMWNERCSAIRLSSIHTLDNWHDIACGYNGIYSFICEVPSLGSFSNISVSANDSNIMSRAGTGPMNNNTSYFLCKSGSLISKKYICDQHSDCEDGSDEEQCDTDCSFQQFKCNDGRCVSISAYCDFQEDCLDGSDESNCVWPPCNQGEWSCNNNQCINQIKVCDLIKDCFDESDELECEECKSPNFQCFDQTCIPQTLTCDGKVDCGGLSFEDESDKCVNNKISSCSEWYSIGARENGEYYITAGLDYAVKVECQFFKRTNTVRTILHHNFEFDVKSQKEEFYKSINYNMENDYIDAIKEQNSCFQNMRIKCHFTIDFFWIGYFNNKVDLKDQSGNNQCSCPFVRNCSRSQIQRCNCQYDLLAWLQPLPNEIREDMGTLTDYHDIPVRAIGQDAKEMSEHRMVSLSVGPLICDTEVLVESAHFLCRSGISVSARHKCLMEKDEYNKIRGCRDLSHLENCESFRCPEDYVKCPNSFCIPVRYMCDNTVHCPKGDDEDGCNRECPGLFHCTDSKVCLAISDVCDGIRQCPHGDDESLCTFECPPSCYCDSHSVECFGYNSCANDTISTDCVSSDKNNFLEILDKDVRKIKFTAANFGASVPILKTYYLAELLMSDCHITFLMSHQFQDLSNLYNLDLSFNELTFLATKTFSGLVNLRTLNLEGNSKLLMIDSMAFDGSDHLPKLIIGNTLIDVLEKDTFRGMNNLQELNLTFNKIKTINDGAFNNLNSLKILDIRKNQVKSFSKDIFQGLTGLRKLYTDAYVFCCLRPNTVAEKNCLPFRDEFSSCSDLLRENILRVFVWIISLSSLVGNFGVFIYKMFYDKISRTKGHGVIITNLSISDFCMGIYMLIIAIADLYFKGEYVWNDISWRNGYICQFAGMLATMSSEASVLFLFLITIDRFLSIKYPFGQIQIHAKAAKIVCACIWMCCFILAFIPLLPITYFNHKFYSRSAVCLALPLTRDKPPGWEYGTAIFICFNFIIFLCIAVGQLLIYQAVSDTKINVNSTRANKDAVIARGLFFVVFSDFLCWFPVGIMGLLALLGKIIPGEVYAWTAVFILPINSALNPFLYTFSAILKHKVVADSWKFGPKMLSRLTSSDMQRDKKWEEICQSQKFVLCGYQQKTSTLETLMETEIPSTSLVFHFVQEMVQAIELLHSSLLIHGKISEDCIIFSTGQDMCLYSLTIPKPENENETMEKDIEDLGLLTKKLLRWRQIHSSNQNVHVHADTILYNTINTNYM